METHASAPSRMAYSADESASALGVARGTIYALIRSGKLRAVKLARRTVIPREELERLLKSA